MVDELLRLSPTERLSSVGDRLRFRGAAVLEELLSRSRDAIFDDPQAGLELASMGITVAERLDPESYSPQLRNDLIGRAWTDLGNARRVLSDHRGAEDAFELAREHIAAGTGDPLEDAHLHYCRNALRSAQRRFAEAHQEIQAAMVAYRKVGDVHLQGRALVSDAVTYARAGDIDTSIRLHREALPLIDRQREPRVFLAAQHNLVGDLVDIGRPAEALALMEDIRPLYERCGGQIILLRRRWIEAQAAMDLGDHARAEEAFLEVRDAFAAREMPYDVAIASLDLANLYAEQGRTAEIRQLAIDALAVFRALKIDREGIAALILFEQAARAEAVTISLIRQLAAYFKKAAGDPSLRFTVPDAPAASAETSRPTTAAPPSAPPCKEAPTTEVLEEITRLCNLSHETTFTDPKLAVSLAVQAVSLARALQPEKHGVAAVASFGARAIASLGDARRVVSDLRGADEALSQAQRLLSQGSGGPLEVAQLDYYYGALRAAQRRFPEAISHFNRAVGAYRRFGDAHQQGRALIGKATACAKAGDLHESIRLQQLALPLIDTGREPRLYLAAQHNLAMDLVDIGRPQEALRILDELRPLYVRLAEKMNLIRLRWLEAQAAKALGDASRAEQAYLEVIAAFESHEIPYDAAAASLELATVYAEQGRTAEIKQLALEMLPVFQALDIQREAIAALMLFRQAAEAETASLALIQHIAGFLKRAQHDPALRFSPPS